MHVSRGDDQLVYVGEYFAVSPEVCKIAMRLGPRLSIFDTKGRLLARLGDYPFGDGPGRFYAPHSVATDSRGDIYVAEVSYSEFGKQKDSPKELRSMQKLIMKSSNE